MQYEAEYWQSGMAINQQSYYCTGSLAEAAPKAADTSGIPAYLVHSWGHKRNRLAGYPEGH